jgi:hypothetical protein
VAAEPDETAIHQLLAGSRGDMSQQAEKRREGWLDIGLSLFLFAVCGSTLYEAGRLPGSDFEPLGPAFLPKLMAWMILILAIAVLVRGIKLVTANPKSEDKPKPMVSRLALYATLLMMAYVSVMYWDLIGYRPATILFITSLGYLLSHFQIRALINSLVLSLVVAFGTHYIFTKVLVIALP